MPDDRDKLTRRPAPAHVRAQTAQPEKKPAPYDQAAPAFEINEWDAKTPVFGDPLQRVEYRQKRQSQQLFVLREKFDSLESKNDQIELLMAEVKTKSEVANALIEKLIQDQADERKAREARELAAITAKAEARKYTFGTIAPTISALGAAIAAIVAAVMASR